MAYLSPIARLGKRRYSILFPLVSIFAFCVLSEIFAYSIAKDPMVVGIYAIYIPAALIIYFSFRDGVRGGFIVSTVTMLYYFYIIYTRNYSGEQLSAGIQTTLVLSALYYFISSIIGWLKQTIDGLIEREANEKRRLRAILQQLPVGVIITDSKGKIVHANKQTERILGVRLSNNYIIGKDRLPTSITLNNKKVSPSQLPIAQVLTTGKTIIGRELVIERPDKKKLYTLVNATPIANSAGKIIAAASIINDVTDQKELEARKDDFVNMASHELKTPITSMKLYTETLFNRVKKHNDERSMKIINSIRYQTDKLQELISDLLDVSQIQTGKLSFNKEMFNLSDLTGEIIDGMQESMQNHTITFTKKSGMTVVADKFRIYQVITNLLTNAAKYSPDGTPIGVGVKRLDDKVILSVKDKGIGIAKDQQIKIFDRLYQVTDHKEKTFPGLGLGLYISREIIKRHKGNIWVESQKDKGSTFYFSLPLAKKS